MNNVISRINLVVLGFLLSDFCLAAGLNKVNKFLENLNTALHTVSIVAVVTAIMITGFKTMYNKESIRDCSGWIMGAALIAGAAEIGAMLLK
ncbi:MAG: type IV secretion protein A [Neisseriaceae bacterium]|nr:MAG: type IV secretion protein A [Neisseriaceae bacterium]